MGIKGLMALIGDCAPGCFKEDVIKNYFGRKVAIDASMSLYSFMVRYFPGTGSLWCFDRWRCAWKEATF
jgi:flap endonuclease-1